MGNMTPPKLWEPSAAVKASSNLAKFISWLSAKKDLHFQEYQELWQWSVDNLEDFWACLWEYFGIMAENPYQSILSGQKMPGGQMV